MSAHLRHPDGGTPGLRLMQEAGLLAPHRPILRTEHLHDGIIMTNRVDEVWGTDMTQTVTTGEGRA